MDSGDFLKNHKVVGFMCLTDFEWELGEASGGERVYPSIEDLRASRKCVEACGIVEVEVSFRRVVHPAAEERVPSVRINVGAEPAGPRTPPAANEE